MQVACRDAGAVRVHKFSAALCKTTEQLCPQFLVLRVLQELQVCALAGGKVVICRHFARRFVGKTYYKNRFGYGCGGRLSVLVRRFYNGGFRTSGVVHRVHRPHNFPQLVHLIFRQRRNGCALFAARHIRRKDRQDILPADVVHIIVGPYLNFKVNQSALLADYMNNPAELAKIHSSIDSIREDDNYRIARIKIVGYSSPEGNYDANARLSEQRAKALVQNLKHAYKLDDSMIECRSVPENWEGLAAWLREYRPSYMQKVLDIIGQTPEPDARDAKIKAIDGGNIYNALLQEVYPKLRLVEYTVSYTVVPFSVEQGREIIKTRPDKMNHNEMYQVAVSYGKGSDEYNRIIRMIADRFPSDRMANNNAAIVAWEMGDYDAMRMYLKRLEGIKTE